jgi:hypothetical protein
MTAIAFIVSHFLIGILLAASLLVYRYKTIGKFKPDDENWFEFSILIFGLLTGGYAALVGLIIVSCIFLIWSFIVFTWHALLQAFDNLKSFREKLIIWTVGFVIFFAIFTECTAPREGANCRDGTYSYATGRGACSWHGGVSSWDKDYWWEDD